MLILDDKQEAALTALEEIKDGGAALIGARMGAGKTVVMAEYIRRTGVKTVLVIGLLNTVRSWKRTLEGQGVDLPFYHLTSTKHDDYDRLKAGEPGVYYIGQEFLAKSVTRTLARPSWKWGATSRKIDLAIYDEVQGMQSRKSKRYNVVKGIKAKRRIAMSGTWFGNRFEGAWTISRWLWPERTNRGFWAWVSEWATIEEETIYAGGEEEVVQRVGDELVPGAFVKSLPLYLTWYRDVGVELLPPKVLYVGMTTRQARAYKSMETDLIAWLNDQPLVAPVPIAKFTRLRQISLGTPEVSWDDEVPEVWFKDDCDSPKIDALVEFAEEHEGSILVLLDSAKFAKVVAHRLNQKFRAGVGLWTGEANAWEREDMSDKFRNGDIRFLVATIQSIGTGTDGLQDSCNTVVWLNKSVNSLLNEQAEARLYRPGQTSDVVTVEIRAEGTLDDDNNSRLAQIVAARGLSLGGENIYERTPVEV